MKYLKWDEKIITDFSDEKITDMYDRGFVFTRIGKGVMHQTRSVRVNLAKFNLTSENRRILKKVADIKLKKVVLPLKEYDFSIGKLAKDFYGVKFGPGIMSAQKIKEMLTDPSKSNFNSLFIYSNTDSGNGYSICHSNNEILHYSYPFYDLTNSPKDMGLGMMIRAIEYAKNAGMKYVYLGSLQRPGDIYKLQFDGLEWFDGKRWSDNTAQAKEILND